MNITKNYISPDNTNTFYIEVDLGAGNYKITFKDNIFPEIYFSNANTRFCDWDIGSNITGTGTRENPYKSIQKCFDTLDSPHYYVCILTKSLNEDNDAGSWPEGRTLNNPLLDQDGVKVFTAGGITPFIRGGNDTDANFFVSNIGGTGSFQIYNVWVNSQKKIVNTEANADYVIGMCGKFNSSVHDEGLILTDDLIEDSYTNKVAISHSFFSGGNSLDEEFTIYDPKYCIFKNLAKIILGSESLENNIFSNIDIFDFNNIAPVSNRSIFYNVQSLINITVFSNINYTLNNLVDWTIYGTGNLFEDPLFAEKNPKLPIDFLVQLYTFGNLLNSPCYRSGNLDESLDIGAWQYLESPPPGIKKIEDYDYNLSLLIQQYKDKPKFKQILQAMNKQAEDLENAIFEIRDDYWLSTAEGEQLDVIGKIVGIDRAGKDDINYREAIRVKIIINNGSGESSTIILFFKDLYGASSVYVLNLGYGIVQVMVDITITQDILNKFIKILAAGVGVIVTFGDDHPFGFTKVGGGTETTIFGFGKDGAPADPDAGNFQATYFIA